MKSSIATAVQEQVFDFETLIADLKQQKQIVSSLPPRLVQLIIVIGPL